MFGQKYETSFYGEDSLKKTVPIPEKAANILKKDEEVLRCFGADPKAQDIKTWFEATRINLNSDGYPDILIKAKDDTRKRESNCINGNAVSFWIFRKNRAGYELVLRLYTISVEIKRKKSNGFFNIDTVRNTGSESYRRFYVFKRNRYIEIGKKVTPIS